MLAMFSVWLSGVVAMGPAQTYPPQHPAPAPAPTQVKLRLLPASAPTARTVVRTRVDARVRARLQEESVAFVVDEGTPCADEACAGTRFEAGGPPVVAIALAVEGRDYDVSVYIVDGEGSRSSTLRCELCGFDEVADRIADATVALVRDTSSSDTPAVLELRTALQGANVFIDGVLVGTTPWEGPLAPGAHTVRIVADGHHPESFELDLAPGTLRAVEVNPVPRPTVQPTSKPDTVPPPAPSRRVAPWVGLGAGIALVGAGVGLLAINHRDVGSRCSDPDATDEAGVCRWRYETVPWGVPLAVVGSAAIVTSVVFLVRNRRKRAGRGTAIQ